MIPRRILVTALSAVLASTAGAHVATAAPAPEVRERIAFVVPGQYLGALPYLPLVESLRLQGYRAQALDLPGFDIDADAHAIGAAVDAALAAHPDAEIALIGHSIGGVSARHYVKHLGGADRVDTYVAFGTPQYGSPGACGQPNGAEVCPGTDFMAGLNVGDDTPGDVAYYSIRSEREWVDGRLDGGQCRMTPTPTAVDGGTDHTLEPVNVHVWAQVSAALAGHCDGEFVDDPDGAFTAEETLFPNGR
ncbi:esterase/lipase family protein [Rhodococcus sp. NPDC003318]|uniref:esterase/lipase family protein n=1 Tax=Rhodococcus sp. NPDC003318 TaxID=3364503 RepID=UPI003689F299